MQSVTTMPALSLHAEAKVNIQGWAGYCFESKESPYGKYFEIKGAVCPLYIQGKKKGKPNYSKANKSTEKTISFTPQEHDIFVSKWEAENDTCLKCNGKGELATAWGVKGAYNIKTCDRCNGTGKPLEAIA